MRSLCANVTKKDTEKKDDREQSKRFVEAAKSLEADESGEAFKKAMESITPTKKQDKK